MFPRSSVAAALTLAVSGCGLGGVQTSTTPSPAMASSPMPTAPVDSASRSAPSGEQTPEPVAFPVGAFAAISKDPVSEELAAELQAALATHDVTGGGGMSATVMTPEGTWSGTTGKADGVRDLQVDDQFAVASITKTVVAAQVLLMVEAGELGLDDPVADHLPADLEFDDNGATVRDLLGHRSGLPDIYEVGPLAEVGENPERAWTPGELMLLVPNERQAPGEGFAYAETNYLVLKLMIEHLRGRPLAGVLRNGVLAMSGLERLVLQPDEMPSEPVAMPAGASDAALDDLGGSLPSLAIASAYQPSGGIASDAASLARWFRALCAGEVVSRASLTEMSTFQPGEFGGPYGLGMYNPALGHAGAFGHTGQLPGYMSWAACLPEEEAVIVVLTNHEVDDGHFAFSHGLARPLVDALRSP